MSRHGWYFTIVSHGETAIEYAVFCVNDEFDHYIQTLRAARQGLQVALRHDTDPTLKVAYPSVALVKTLVTTSEEALEDAIDNTSGFWAQLPLQPMQEILHESGHLTDAEVLNLLRETEVSGSHARLVMNSPDHPYFTIDPGDADTNIETSYISSHLLPPHPHTDKQ